MLPVIILVLLALAPLVIILALPDIILKLPMLHLIITLAHPMLHPTTILPLPIMAIGQLPPTMTIDHPLPTAVTDPLVVLVVVLAATVVLEALLVAEDLLAVEDLGDEDNSSTNHL
jgi:hypothetical protein